MSWGLFPVEVAFGGRFFEIPAMPALGWLTLTMDIENFDPLAIFPGLLSDEEQDAAWELMIDQNIPVAELGNMSLLTIAAAAGRPWWVALRLIAAVAQNQHTLGAKMLMRGVDASKLSLAGWLDIVLLTAMQEQKKEDATMFSMRLEQVPASEVANVPEPEIAASQFMSMA